MCFVTGACRSIVERVALSIVMAGLVPGTYVFIRMGRKDVDGRDKPGHDG
jgi:hypothetical protein